jgi:DNA adenine methylase
LYAKPKSKLETVNDINGDLINLHRVIRDHPQTLSTYLNQLCTSRVIFDNIRLRNYQPRNGIERAAYFYYLISQSFGSKGQSFAMATK